MLEISEYMSDLHPCVMARLLDANDTIAALVSLADKRPWIRRSVAWSFTPLAFFVCLFVYLLFFLSCLSDIAVIVGIVYKATPLAAKQEAATQQGASCCHCRSF